MFEHSIKVPRLYKVAAKLVRECVENGASVKQSVYQAKHKVGNLRLGAHGVLFIFAVVEYQSDFCSCG